jgi:biofilm PGA synthesis lipoprotein PgaB
VNNNTTTRRRAKRKRSFIPDLALVVLILSVAATCVLLIIAKPFSSLTNLFKQPAGSDSRPVVQAPSPPPLSVSSPATVTMPSTLPAGSAYLINPRLPLTITRVTDNGVTLVLVEGGVLGSRRSPIRQRVVDFVREAGATAGLNGTFFANASLNGTDNLLIGPSLCDNETTETMSPFDTKPQLQGRPLVVVSPTATSIVPYDTSMLSMPGAIQNLLPNVTSAFLGGVWLVHNGTASTLGQLNAYNVHDAEDPRRRAFFAIMPDGRPVLGATDGSTTSRHLARSLAAAGIQEAVLLDSGFSTSLVFQSTVLVTGHSTKTLQSRPVPQALVLYGQPDPATVAQLQAAGPTSLQ